MYRFILAVITILVISCNPGGCRNQIQVGPIDNEFEIREIVEVINNEEVVRLVELHPGRLPFAILADETVEDRTLLPEAIGWWNRELSQDGTKRTVFVEAQQSEPPRVTVSVGLAPSPESDLMGGGEPIGTTTLFYAEDGEIISAEIILSSDIAYHRPTLLLALKSEIGSVLGLMDDQGPPQTVDLRSIMAEPPDPLGRLTRHDFELLRPYLP